MTIAFNRLWLKGKKKAIALSTAAAITAMFGASLTPTAAFASSVQVNCSTSGTFTVETNGADVVTSSGANCVGEVQIPADVTNVGEYTFANNNQVTAVTFLGSAVQRISNNAFFNTGLTSLVIPSSVTYIGHEAFMYSGGLTSLTFAPGSQLERIESSAFRGNSPLTSVTIPASVVSIGSDAFMTKRNLTTLAFEAGSSLTTISNGAFTETGITSVTLPAFLQNFTFAAFPANTVFSVDSGNPYITFLGGVMFSGDLTVLKGYPSGASASSYVIPSSVTAIGNNAFQNAQFTSVTIPSSVTSIGTSAFTGSRLTSVTIPASVATIGTYAFNEVPNLQSVTFAPGSATTFLSNGSFQNLTNLTSLDFGVGSNLRTIDAQAFRSSRLTSVVIPASVEYINDYAFYYSGVLATVTFEANSRLRQIGAIAFAETPLSSITLPNPPVRAHYNFIGWAETENGTLVDDPASLVTSDRNLYSRWELMTFPVAFDSNLGSPVDSTQFEYGGSLAAPTAPTRAGFTFNGWSATEGGSAVVFPYSPGVQSGITLYALWTENAPEEPTITEGSIPNSQVATIPVGLTAAELPATAALPRVSLNFAATSESATATVAPIDNPADASVTPFAITGTTKIVDIQVSGITGPVTVCLDGASTDDIFHFTGGAWVSLPNRTYVNGQVCGVTMNFSPFAAAALRPAPASTLPRPVAALPVPMFEMGSRLAVLDKGQRLTLQGKNLNEIDSIRVGGKEAKIIEKAAGEVVIDVPASAEGFPEVVVLHKNGTVSIQGWMQVVAPYALTRSIKITRFVGDRPTLAGIAALERTFLAGPTANIVTCIMTVAVDASAAEVAKAEMRTRKACQRVVKLSARIKTTDVRVSRSGEPGSKPVLSVTFDRTLSGS